MFSIAQNAAATARQPSPDVRPMVLHARIVTGGGGGPDKTILNSPRFLSLLGYDSACLYLRHPADAGFAALAQRAVQWSAPLEPIDDRGPLDATILVSALTVCRRLHVNVWHAHDYKTNLLGLALRRFHRMKLVTTVHGWVERTWRTNVYHNLDRISFHGYHHLVCVSGDLFDECRRMGVQERRLTLIENAIDVEQFRRRKTFAEAKQALDWPTTRLMIFAAGRLSAEKGFSLLIEAIGRLVEQGLDVGLAIAGAGDERDNLSEVIKQRGLERRVQLLGFQSNLIPYYEAADVFALSSLREGLPNVLLEAMALETPVVATRIAGVPRVIDHDQSGLLIAPGDVAELAAALQRMLADPGLRSRLAATARDVIESRYSFAARMQKMVEVYRTVGVAPGTAQG